MRFTALMSCLLACSAVALADSLSFDKAYDNKSGLLSSTACSDGSNGLSNSYETFGDLPKFPYIGGAKAISSWNSPNCGTCWKLTYTNKGKSKSINVLAIDVADDGFNISLEAMNVLTNNTATKLGRIDVTSKQVDASKCGI
jgi:hypothetical protein